MRLMRIVLGVLVGVGLLIGLSFLPSPFKRASAEEAPAAAATKDDLLQKHIAESASRLEKLEADVRELVLRQDRLAEGVRASSSSESTAIALAALGERCGLLEERSDATLDALSTLLGEIEMAGSTR